MNFKKIRRIFGYALIFIKYLLLYPIALIKYSGKTIYLISERGNDARDNGYHMFRYYREKHPELEVYYVITPNSVDRKKIESYGNLVNYKSARHYMLFAAAKYRISTHIMGFSPDRYFFSTYERFIPSRCAYNIFLQHGVIKNDHPPLYRENTNLDIFICGAKPEFDFIDETFHYTNGEVKYTGLARFDALYDFKTKNQILIMPTWRQYLAFSQESQVENSAFTLMWNAVLTNPRLCEFAEKNEIDIVFYPHIEMHRYLHLFKSHSDRIKIADFEKYDVQTLLKESKLLVTDFSSVFFDFAYMQKPSLYFQFDEEAYYGGHYDKGYFDYRDMGFGKVVLEPQELVDEIIACAEGGFVISDFYKNRIDGFFPLCDKNNCKRIFDEIERL